MKIEYSSIGLHLNIMSSYVIILIAHHSSINTHCHGQTV